jgi:hypothetical protein
MFQLIWVFSNDHEWHRNFHSLVEREQFIRRTGLLTHPDIVRVTVRIGQCSADLKFVHRQRPLTVDVTGA